jgi:hypothetical protein
VEIKADWLILSTLTNTCRQNICYVSWIDFSISGGLRQHLAPPLASQDLRTNEGADRRVWKYTLDRFDEHFGVASP